MRILITGVTGYIGSHLARRLLSSHQVFGLVREPVNMTYIRDIADKLTLLPYSGSGESLLEQVKHCKPDLVYHLAAYYTGAHDVENVTKLVSSNITLGAYLLEAMVSCGCRHIIYASTIMEHYQGAEYCPLNFYAATKRAFYDLLCYYTDTGMLHAGVLVLADTYGPDDQRPKILNLVKQHLGTDTPIALSDGRQEYAVLYIDDAVKAFEMAGQQLCIKKWDRQFFQLLPNEIYTLRETVDRLVQISKTTLHAQWGSRPASKRQIQKVPRLYPPVPGWSPRVSLETGLKEILGTVK